MKVYFLKVKRERSVCWFINLNTYHSQLFLYNFPKNIQYSLYRKMFICKQMNPNNFNLVPISIGTRNLPSNLGSMSVQSTYLLSPKNFSQLQQRGNFLITG